MNYIYTRSNPPCPWCDKVKSLLQSYSVSYAELDMSEQEAVKEDFLERGFKSVPQVILNNKHIGGFDATSKYLRGE